MIQEDLNKIDTSAKFLLSLLNDVLDMSKIDSRKMKLAAAPFHIDEVVGQLKDIFLLQAEQKRAMSQWWISALAAFAVIAIIVAVIVVSKFARMMRMK